MGLKQRHMKFMRKGLSWLLLLVTLLLAVAGNSLPVQATSIIQAETETEAAEYKHKMSYTYRRTYTNFEHIEASASLESNFQLFLYGDIPVPATSGSYSLGYVDSLGVCRPAVTYNADFIPDTRTGNGIYFSAFHWARIQTSTGVVNAERNGPLPGSLMTSSMYDALRIFILDINKGDNYTCTGYVFKSLDAAQAYFDSGDTSGLVQQPVTPPSGGDSDVNDGWLQDLIKKLKEWEEGAFGALVGPFIAFGEGLLDIKHTIISLLPERIREIVTSVLDDSVRIAWDVFNIVGEIRSFLKDKALELFGFLKNIHDELIKIGVGIVNLSWDLLPDGIKEKLQPWLDGLSGLLEKVRDGIDIMGQKLTDMLPSFNDIRNMLRNSRLGEYVADIKEDFTKLKELLTSFPAMSAAVSNFLEDPFYYIKKGIEKGFKDSFLGLLILPSDKFMKEFGEDLRKDFSGIFSIIEEVKKMINWMANSSRAKAPKFTINLGESASYDLGNTSVTIDFSWYDAYKPTVDLLFAAIIWAGFLWRMYSRIPEILNGMGMVVVMPYQIQHMDMERDRKDLARSRSDARWEVWERRNR